MTNTERLAPQPSDLSEIGTVSRLLREHLGRLRSNYSTTLEEYQKAYPGKMPLVVWQVGGTSGSHSDLAEAVSREWPLETEWVYFSQRAGDGSRRYGKIRVVSSQVDLLAQMDGSDRWFGVSAMRNVLREVNGRDGQGLGGDFLNGDGLCGEPWPDIIIAENFLYDQSASAPAPLSGYLNYLYHFLEPGGLLIALEPEETMEARVVEKFVGSNGGSTILANGKATGTLYKQPNVYMDPSVRIGSRKEIFDARICQDTVNRAMDRVKLDEGDWVLDVGVGDGRFSRHIASVSKARKWFYRGVEKSPHASLHLANGELAESIAYNTGFFDLPSHERYGAVCLFFVMHSFKHWQLYLYKASQLLQEGGYLVLSLRHDDFTYWLNGIFSDGFASPVRDAWKEYWDARSHWGIRNFNQMLTVIWPAPVTASAEQVGFSLVADPLIVSGLRQYNLHSRDLCHSRQEPVLWNIAEVGVTTQDRDNLQNALRNSAYLDELYETVATFIFRKNHEKQ